jgi:hypothetical protein
VRRVSDDKDDLQLQRGMQAAGLCAGFGPSPDPDLKLRPYMCNLDAGHRGAHVASIAGEVVDTWP